MTEEWIQVPCAQCGIDVDVEVSEEARPTVVFCSDECEEAFNAQQDAWDERELPPDTDCLEDHSPEAYFLEGE